VRNSDLPPSPLSRRGLLAAAAGLLLVRPAPAAADVGRPVADTVKKFDVSDSTPGVAVGVYQPGKISYTGGFGRASLTKAGRITAATRFELASLSKPFTALAVLALSDKGKLSTAAPARRYLPELPDYTPGQPITVLHLLRHTSGLPDYMDLTDVGQKNKKYWVNEDYVPEFARQRKKFPHRFKPGEKFEYNNSNYMLLATIAARVAKKPFASVLREHVFARAKMTSAFVYDSQDEVRRPPPVAVGYTPEKGKKPWRESWGAPPDRTETELAVGDGSVFASVDDLLLWDRALRAGSLLKAATMREALRPSTTKDGKTNDYGLGWRLVTGAGGKARAYWHKGVWRGFNALYYRDLAKDRSCVVLSNRGDFRDRMMDFYKALDRALDGAARP